MKRACLFFIAIAAFVVLLLYPSTHPYAAAPQVTGENSGPNVVTPRDVPPMGQAADGGGDADDGDSDDLAGYRDKWDDLGRTGSLGQRVQLYVNMWWKFMVWIR